MPRDLCLPCPFPMLGAEQCTKQERTNQAPTKMGRIQSTDVGATASITLKYTTIRPTYDEDDHAPTLRKVQAVATELNLLSNLVKRYYNSHSCTEPTEKHPSVLHTKNNKPTFDLYDTTVNMSVEKSLNPKEKLEGEFESEFLACRNPLRVDLSIDIVC